MRMPMKTGWIRAAVAAAALGGFAAACERNSDVRDPDVDGVAGLVIEPSSATVRTGTTRLLVARGGIAPYTWNVDNAAVGTVDPDINRTELALYRAGAVRDVNSVRVRDSHNPPWSATMSIVQE